MADLFKKIIHQNHQMTIHQTKNLFYPFPVGRFQGQVVGGGFYYDENVSVFFCEEPV